MFVEVVVAEDGVGEAGGVVEGAYSRASNPFRGYCTKCGAGVVFLSSSQEQKGEDDVFEFESLGFVDGEDADGIGVLRGGKEAFVLLLFPPLEEEGDVV